VKCEFALSFARSAVGKPLPSNICALGDPITAHSWSTPAGEKHLMTDLCHPNQVVIVPQLA